VHFGSGSSYFEAHQVKERIMKSITAGLGIIGASLVMFAASGCGEDNEKSAKLTSAPPGTGANAPPRTQAEYGKQNVNPTSASAGYPGAKK